MKMDCFLRTVDEETGQTTAAAAAAAAVPVPSGAERQPNTHQRYEHTSVRLEGLNPGTLLKLGDVDGVGMRVSKASVQKFEVYVLKNVSRDDTAPSVGGFSAELESLSTYLSTAQQQETHSFKMDLRQGLTPPQMPGDHMHPYGTRKHRF